MLRYLHPRWVALHIFVLTCCVAMVYAGRWQWRVARVHGDLQNYAYAVQWNVFVLFAIALWIKVMRDAHGRASTQDRGGARPVRPAPDGGVAQAATYRGYAMPQSSAITVEDPELARYNAYLTALAQQSANPVAPADRGSS